MYNLKSFRVYLTTALLVGTMSFALAQDPNNVAPGGAPAVDSTKQPLKAIRPPVEGIFNSPGGKKMHVYKKSPVPLTPIREADGLWHKTVWQFIDVREKINQQFYFPIGSKPIGDRISLLKVMQYAANYDTILVKTRNLSLSNLYGTEFNVEEPLRAYDNDYVNVPLTYEEMRNSFGYSVTKRKPILDGDGQPTGDYEPPVKVSVEYQPTELIGFEIKEVWMFDKQRSVLDNSHIVAIRPIFLYAKEEASANQAPGAIPAGDDEEEDDAFEIGRGAWYYFPELRFFTANADVFNQTNPAECRSFDDVFLKRRFSSVIKQEENEKDNRSIQEYVLTGLDQVLASEKIKDDIRRLEHDLWEF